MKILAIEIESTKIIPVVLEIDGDNIKQVDTGVKSIGITDDLANNQLRKFQQEVFAFIDEVIPDKIGILKRQTKGKFSASSSSFKLEALIQCYTECEVEFVAKTTLNAYYKKNDFVIEPHFKYQLNAARLGQYLGRLN